MDLKRREFITASLVALVAACTKASATKPDIILGGGQYILPQSQSLQYVLSVVDVSNRTKTLTPMRFLAHGIHWNPVDENRLAIFEKKGPHACEYDLQSQQVVREIPKRDGHYFYGHGAYSAEGSLLFSTETELKQLNGVIAVRDSKSLDYLEAFPSYGKEPHECKLIDDGQTLVVTNGGGLMKGEPPSVTYIEVKTQQLLERVELTNHKLNAGHIAISDKGDIVVVSAPRLGLEKQGVGGISIRADGIELESMGNPAAVTNRMRGEALSVVIHDEANIAAVTHPDGGMVTFWSIKEKQLLKVVNLPHPRGVTMVADETAFLISYGRDASLVSVLVEGLLLQEDQTMHSSYITGSHIYNWSRGMKELYYPRGMS